MHKKVIEFLKTQDNVVTGSFFATLLGTFILTLTIAITMGNLPQKVPLFYSLPWGEAQLVSKPQLFLLPLLILLVGLVNLVMSWQLHESQLPLKRIIHISTVIFAVLIFITTLRVILIFL